MRAAIDWLAGLPEILLAAVLAGLAFIENIVPPVPSDTLIAIMTFLAAAADRPVAGLMGAVIVGSAGGGMLTYWLGRRFGAEGLTTVMRRRGLLAEEARLERAYARYGVLALFAGRLVPGLRSIVPVFAGALRLPMISSLLVITAASTLWYSALAYLAHRAGGNWEAIETQLRALGRTGGLIALIAVGVVALFVRQRRRGKSAA
jgi:membrane protein DedA with SNARE-associated domain